MSGKEGLLLFLSFLYPANNSKILNSANNSKILNILLINKDNWLIKWYHSKWTRGTQPLSCLTLSNLKLGREKLQGKASRKSDIDEIVF